MSNEQAVELLGQLEEAGVQVWVDGGWGVDALIGYQTREHDDLDLVIPSIGSCCLSGSSGSPWFCRGA